MKKFLSHLEKNFKKRGIDILTNAIVEKAEVKGNKVNVTVNVNGQKKVISAEKVLNAIGVVGNVDGIGLEELECANRKESYQGE